MVDANIKSAAHNLFLAATEKRRQKTELQTQAQNYQRQMNSAMKQKKDEAMSMKCLLRSIQTM